jgi:AcrR family transcriptional regulator
MVQKRKSTMVRKQQIIDAARKLIVKKGSEHLTVRSIANVVNITEAAIYRHFRSKREILSFLMNHITESMTQDLNTKLLKGTSSLEGVNEILTRHLSEIEEKRGMSFQVIAEIISLGDKKLNKEVYDSIVTYLDRLRSLLLEGVRGGFVREDIDLEATAMLIFGMLQGLVNFWALSNYSFDLAKKYSSLWAILREAILKGHPSGWGFASPTKNLHD